MEEEAICKLERLGYQREEIIRQLQAREESERIAETERAAAEAKRSTETECQQRPVRVSAVCVL